MRYHSKGDFELMTTNTSDRKALAQALAAELGTEVRYLGVPSCAYQAGNYTIRKDGTIEGNLEAIHDFLIRQGLIQEETDTQTEESEPERETNTDPSPTFERDVDSTELSIPCVDLTPQQLINLIRILYSRQKLLAAMIKNDSIRIDEELIGLLNDEKPETAEGEQVSNVWPFDQRMHLLMNLAWGGTWGGREGTDRKCLPAKLEVDYVRVYQSPKIMALAGQGTLP